MTKMKTLSAVLILSAAVAAPVFAQDAGARGPGSRSGLQSQHGPRGAYNQLNGSSYVIPRTGSGRNTENFGSIERDPSIPGGEDTTLRPSSS
jgi:hypothetical protein